MKAIRKMAILATLAIVAVVLVGCNKKTQATGDSKTYYDNNEDPLVFSTSEVDKVFNPFFHTSATDGNVTGMTQMGMLGNDSEGKVVFGDEEAVIAKDLQIITNDGTPDVDQLTTYYFVLKNNVKYSNGSPLTIKDVLFNLYVYLDPAYTGSSTIYSTDIVGLKEYRTQQADEKEQDNFMKQFAVNASQRISSLLDVNEMIFDELGDDPITLDEYKAQLQSYIDELGTEVYGNIVNDFDKAIELFKKELQDDYTNAKDSYQDQKFFDKDGKAYEGLFTTDVEMYLYNEGYISWNKKDGKLVSKLTNNPADLKNWTEEQAINAIFSDKVPYAIDEIVLYWATAGNLFDFIVNAEMEASFAGKDRAYENISGIKFANMTEPVTVNGKTYSVPQYENDGTCKADYNEVLSITINNVDPKAIWNFSFSVAPMYYYSDQEHINKFDFVSNFGVEFSSQTFMNDVVNAPSKVGVPVGAGAYAASKSSGGFDNVQAGDFYEKGVIYFERNPYYLMGTPKIKKIRFQVVGSTSILNSLYNGEIDFAEPNAKPQTITELNGKAKDGIGNQSVRTSGYGYIGINAGKVPDVQVRQAIMHAINTQETVEYYKTTATAIHRSMSMASWAYPKGCTSYYPYIGGAVPENLDVVSPYYKEYVTTKGWATGYKPTEAEQIEFIKDLVESAGYTINSDGIYVKGTNKLQYIFTIAGEETDHPAWNAMYHASQILNKCGFSVDCKTDANALKKLSSGALTVWAAAWGSTIDPDMYQVYHKDSTATSVQNWGYKQILANTTKYAYEYSIIEELSELIDEGRKYTENEKRAPIYSAALDLVMQLAVELPTYQRNDLYAYSTNKIDVTTFTPENEVSPYKGLTSELHNLSLVVENKVA